MTVNIFKCLGCGHNCENDAEPHKTYNDEGEEAYLCNLCYND